MLVCSFKVILGKLIVCQSNNIMHYIVLHTVQTWVTFNRLTLFTQCLSYHESKLFLDQLVVLLNNKLALNIMKYI